MESVRRGFTLLDHHSGGFDSDDHITSISSILRNSVLFFNVVHFNTCSLACRYNELIVMSEKYYFDAIAVSETWLTKS